MLTCYYPSFYNTTIQPCYNNYTPLLLYCYTATRLYYQDTVVAHVAWDVSRMENTLRNTGDVLGQVEDRLNNKGFIQLDILELPHWMENVFPCMNLALAYFWAFVIWGSLQGNKIALIPGEAACCIPRPGVLREDLGIWTCRAVDLCINTTEGFGSEG